MTLDIEALRELLAAATPGPWHINEDGEIYGPCPIVAACLVGIAPDEVAHLILQPEDAALIVALRNQAGPLLDRLEASEEGGYWHGWADGEAAGRAQKEEP